MLKPGIDPEKLYRATFIRQYGLCCCNMALFSFRLFCKNLGHLREFFGQMVWRPPWQKISRTPMVGPYVVLSFLLLLFCVLCGVIVNSVLKSRCSIISAPGFWKRPKQRTNLVRRCSPENYYTSGRNTELKLCRLWPTYIGGDGFWTVNDHNASDSNLLFLCLLLSALPSLW